jgi:hypothetical protein
MPNWCLNRLVITGPEGEAGRFVAQAKGPIPAYGPDPGKPELGQVEPAEDTGVSILSFYQIIPIPDEALAGPYHFNGVDVEQASWGVIGGAYNVVLHYSDDECACYEFDTKGEPPLAFVQAASEKFPKCSFDIRWDEPNEDFYGRAVFAAGRLVREISWEGRTVLHCVSDELLARCCAGTADEMERHVAEEHSRYCSDCREKM